MYEEHLINLGFPRREAEVYLALLELGRSPASTISRKLGLKRTTVYSTLESLRQKGLVGVWKNKHLCYAAVDPEVLLETYNQKTLREKHNLESICKILTDLSFKPQNTPPDNPHISLFNSLKGIKQVLNDTLKAQKTLLRYSSLRELKNKELLNLLEKCDRARTTKNPVDTQILAYNNNETRTYWQNCTSDLTKIRWINEKFSTFDNEIFIYNNRVSLISLLEDELFGMIIEGKSTAKTHRRIFELAWKGAGIAN